MDPPEPEAPDPRSLGEAAEAAFEGGAMGAAHSAPAPTGNTASNPQSVEDDPRGISARIRVASVSSANGFVSTCIPGSRWSPRSTSVSA